MTGKKRFLEYKAYRFLEQFPVLGIVGVRQCGKTTLAKQLGDGWTYFDLEKPSDYRLVSSDIELFFAQYPDKVIIDEAQLYPPLFSQLRHEVDKKREIKGRFIITGSSQPALINQISESLAGRIGTLELSPLKAAELNDAPLSSFYSLFEAPLKKPEGIPSFDQIPMQAIDAAWCYGGYPEVRLLGDDLFQREWMDQYLQTYIQRDLSGLFPKLDKVKYDRFIRVLMHKSAQLINKSEIGRVVECNESTIRDYIDIADGTFIWRDIPSFHDSKQKSLTKMPKGLVRDSGLLHHMLRIQDIDDLLTHPIAGHSFETFVIEELLRGVAATTATQIGYSHYRTRGGAEIDLILEGSFGCLPIEIKLGVDINPKKLTGLRQFVEDRHLPFGLLINKSQRIQWITPEILQVPVNCL